MPSLILPDLDTGRLSEQLPRCPGSPGTPCCLSPFHAPAWTEDFSCCDRLFLLSVRMYGKDFPVFWKTESLLLFATRIPLLVQRSRNVSSWDSRFTMISALSDLMICRLLLVRHRPLQPSDKIGWSSEKVDFALSSLLNHIPISTYLLHAQLIQRESTGKVPS